MQKLVKKWKKKLCFFGVHLGEELWQKENDFCVLSKLDFVNIVDLYLVNAIIPNLLTFQRHSN